MKFFKSLLLFFLFFGLGNFKAQKIEKISNEEQSRFVFVENFQNLLMKNYNQPHFFFIFPSFWPKKPQSPKDVRHRRLELGFPAGAQAVLLQFREQRGHIGQPVDTDVNVRRRFLPSGNVGITTARSLNRFGSDDRSA